MRARIVVTAYGSVTEPKAWVLLGGVRSRTCAGTKCTAGICM